MVTIDELSLPLSMSDFDDSPILLANHFLIQHQPDEFVVSLSQVTAPPLVQEGLDEHDRLMGDR